MKSLFFFLTLLLLLPITYGIGISPAVAKADYDTEKVHGATFYIRNSQDVPMDIQVSVEEDFIELVDIEQVQMLHIGPGSYGALTFKYKMKEGLEPGSNVVIIKASEATFTSTGMFRVNSGVVGRLQINVPYPGLYTKGKLTVDNINYGENIPFKVWLQNLGKTNVTDGALTLFFRDPNGNLIREVKFRGIVINSLREYTIEEVISNDGFDKGIYNVEAQFLYGKTLVMEDDFIIGTFYVSIENHSTSTYVGEITPYQVEVLSNWNSRINDVYVELKVGDNIFPSPTKQLIPFGREKFTAYIDDPFLEVNKTYPINITVYYEDKSTSVVRDLLVVHKPPPQIEEPAKQPIFDVAKYAKEPVTYLVLLVVITIIFNTIMLMRVSRNDKKKK